MKSKQTKTELHDQNHEKLQSLFDQTANITSTERIDSAARFAATLPEQKFPMIQKLLKFAYKYGFPIIVVLSIWDISIRISKYRTTQQQKQIQQDFAQAQDLVLEEEFALALFDTGFADEDDYFFELSVTEDFSEDIF